jgi:hypothetical protein
LIALCTDGIVLPSPCARPDQLRDLRRQVSIHCLADDARTVVAPFKRVASLETLYRLMKYVGGDPHQCRREIKDWGHGGCWADVKPEHYDLAGH